MKWHYSATISCPECGETLNYGFAKVERLSKVELNEIIFRFNCPHHGFIEKKGSQLSEIKERETVEK